MMIDTHAHLVPTDYTEQEIFKIVENMKSNIIIVSGTDYSSNKAVLELCNKYENVYGTVGYFPTCAKNLDTLNFEKLEEFLNNPKIVGIGEIGLDYHYDQTYKDNQKLLFKRQIDLARKYNKTLVIHSRDSIEDTYNILSQCQDMKMVIHCFSSSLEMAKKFVKLGAFLGIGGVITFKNAKTLQNVVENIDLKHLVLETDSPYLTPEPFRGKKNDPYYVLYVAQKIAQIKGIDMEEVLKVTSLNAVNQFDLNI